MTEVAQSNVPLERDVFLRHLLRELAGTLQDVVGLDEASGSTLRATACIAGWTSRWKMSPARDKSRRRFRHRAAEGTACLGPGAAAEIF